MRQNIAKMLICDSTINYKSNVVVIFAGEGKNEKEKKN